MPGPHPRRRRWWTISSAAILAAAFTILAVLVTVPTIAAWDVRIDLAINSVMPTDTVLLAVAVAISTAGGPLVIDVLTAVAVVVVWLRGSRAWRARAALYLVAARLLELGMETLVKHLTARRRPLLPHQLATAQDTSFPSGHTAGTAVFCGSLLVLVWPHLSRSARGWWTVCAAAAVCLVGASRVLLGVHFPTDVLGGALLGTAIAMALSPILAPPHRCAGLSVAESPRHR